MGRPFDEATIEAVWNKAAPSDEHPPLRVDAHGALIWREGYGNNSSKFGWEIGHRIPVSQGGGDDLDNLEPLQWQNNRRNGDS
jgi:5-methylcytosine-specific restriction endonuclease McrA